MAEILGDKRIAVVVARYCLEVSPIVKGLCSYLSEKHSRPIDVFVLDELTCRRSCAFRGMNLVHLKPRLLCGGFLPTAARDFGSRVWNRLARCVFNGKTVLARAIAKRRLSRFRDCYDLVFCVEGHSLLYLVRAGFDLSKVVYLSLEGADILKELFDPEEAARLLERCALCVIPSQERRDGLQDELGAKLECEYVPVGLRPVSAAVSPPDRPLPRGRPRIIHSGYFAEWSYLREFVRAYLASGLAADTPLYLQGHAMTTQKYLAEIRALVESAPKVTIDETYYDDDEHLALLARHDVGVALYQNPSGSSNWQNLIFSSGKIASYLWAGLAVITNVSAPSTAAPPFLRVDRIDPQAITNAVQRYAEDPALYRRSATEVAAKYYNLDVHLDKMVKHIAHSRACTEQ